MLSVLMKTEGISWSLSWQLEAAMAYYCTLVQLKLAETFGVKKAINSDSKEGSVHS